LCRGVSSKGAEREVMDRRTMKLVSTLPLIFLVASSALGQRGGASAGHAGSGASSGRSFSMASPGPSHFSSSVPAYHPNLGAPARSAYNSPAYSSPIGPPPFGGTQPNPGKHYPYPTNGNRGYYSRGAYFYPTYLGYGGFYGYAGYPDDSSYGDQPQPAPAYQDTNYQDAPAQAPPANSYDESSAQPNYGQAGYGQAPAPRPAYQPQASAPAPIPDQPETTLLFKDGRPPQQVQNYAVTSTTLYVLDGERRRAIPLNEIDLPQTEKTNRDAGLDFEVPAGAE
jgi:hypothetical protein